MSFRCTRRSNDGYTWLTFFMAFTGVIFIGFIALIAFAGKEIFPKIFSAGIWFGFLIALISSARDVLCPYEWELVATGDQIRWGRVFDPDKQRRVLLAKIKRIVYEKSDNQLSVDIGSWRLLPVGNYVLVKTADTNNLVDFLKQNYPQLKIEVR
jgi:hypothetical protein